MTKMTETEAIQRLKAACDAVGSQKAFCEKHNLGSAVISQVLNGRLPMPPSVFKVIGLNRVTMFEEVSNG